MSTIGAGFLMAAKFFTWLAQKSGQKNTDAMVAAQQAQEAVAKKDALEKAVAAGDIDSIRKILAE